MLQTYPKAIKLVLHHEGGWSNHPNDPGGATNFGVTQGAYDAFRRNRGLAGNSPSLSPERTSPMRNLLTGLGPAPRHPLRARRAIGRSRV